MSVFRFVLVPGIGGFRWFSLVFVGFASISTVNLVGRVSLVIVAEGCLRERSG